MVGDPPGYLVVTEAMQTFLKKGVRGLCWPEQGTPASLVPLE